jgi:hypothetical protein
MHGWWYEIHGEFKLYTLKVVDHVMIHRFRLDFLELPLFLHFSFPVVD